MKDSSLYQLAIRAYSNKDLLASKIEQYSASHGITWEKLAAEHNLELEQLSRLALCKIPRGIIYQEDVAKIADYTGLPTDRLLDFLAAIEKEPQPQKAPFAMFSFIKDGLTRPQGEAIRKLRPYVFTGLAVIGLLFITTALLARVEPTQATLIVGYGEAEVTQIQPVFLFINASQESILSEGEAITLREGDTIVLGENAIAQLAFSDGNIVDIYEDTTLTIDRLRTEDQQPYAVRLALASGRIFSRVHQILGIDGTFDVQTPSSTASVRGTAFGAEILSDDAAFFNTVEGSVAVQLGEEEALVNAGEELTAAPGEPLIVEPARDTTPPILTVTSPTFPPEPGTIVTVSGQTEIGALVRVGGLIVNTDDAGRFETTIELGDEALQIEASDRLGNTTTIQFDTP